MSELTGAHATASDRAVEHKGSEAAGDDAELGVGGCGFGRSPLIPRRRARPRVRRSRAQLFEEHWKWRPQGDSNPCYRRERAVS